MADGTGGDFGTNPVSDYPLRLNVTIRPGLDCRRVPQGPRHSGRMLHRLPLDILAAVVAVGVVPLPAGVERSRVVPPSWPSRARRAEKRFVVADYHAKCLVIVVS